MNADPVLRATKEKAEKGDKAAALKLYDRYSCALCLREGPRYAHYTQVEPNEKEAAYWLKAASDSRIAQSAPPSAPVRTGMRVIIKWMLTLASS